MDREETKKRLSGRAMECSMFTDSEEKESNIILFPDFQKLKEAVEKMRIELSMLVSERDELQYVICKNIETAYCLKLGALEHRTYEAQCKALRLKRKIELIQACVNRQEKIIMSQIEGLLDDEFAEYEAKLEEQIENMNEALYRSRGEYLTGEESKELKKLYRNIVKQLHPDVNPDVTEEQIRLLDNAIVAYKNGDLAAMRIIYEMVGEHDLPDLSQDSLSALAEESKRIEGMVASVRQSISQIKSQYPYTVKEFVEKPEKEAQRRAELKTMLEQYNELIERYNMRLNEMLR